MQTHNPFPEGSGADCGAVEKWDGKNKLSLPMTQTGLGEKGITLQ